MERSYKKRALLEIVMKIVFLAAACMSVLCVALICIFLFANGLPAMGEIGVLNFLSGTRWKPGADIYGIFPMILGSIYVTAGALLMGVPVALLTAIDLAFFCPQKLYRVLKPAVELLAGIPSVVYGFFGIVVLVPMVRALGEKWDGSGNSMLTASILLAIMILPTIIGVVEPALRAVPCRGAITRARWRWARRMSAACTPPLCPRPGAAFWRALCWAWAARWARRWPSSWWRAISRACRRAFCRACAR